MKRRNTRRGCSRPIPLAAQLLLAALLVAVLTLVVLRASDAVDRMETPAGDPYEAVLQEPDTTAS